MSHSIDRRLLAEVVKIHVPISLIGPNKEVESFVLETHNAAYIVAFEESPENHPEEIGLFVRPATPEQLEFLQDATTKIEIRTFVGSVEAFERSSVAYLTQDGNHSRDEQRIIINLSGGKTISLRRDGSNLYPYSFRLDNSIEETLEANIARR